MLVVRGDQLGWLRGSAAGDSCSSGGYKGGGHPFLLFSLCFFYICSLPLLFWSALLVAVERKGNGGTARLKVVGSGSSSSPSSFYVFLSFFSFSLLFTLVPPPSVLSLNFLFPPSPLFSMSLFPLGLFIIIILFLKQLMKRCCFRQNASFHLIENDSRNIRFQSVFKL